MRKSSERDMSISTDDKLFHSNTPSDKENNTKQEKANTAGEVSQIRDVNSRDIFKNNTLTSQFLRDYSGFSLFDDIGPEDIEDQTIRFRQLLGIEVESDTVKKVHVKLDDQEEEIYVISMIEHKSQVDYDVAMQLLHYMSVIWKEYGRKCDQEKEKVSKRKYFRYPLIIPIIYYEGADRWTAGMHLSDRISHAELARDYIPDFTYQIVPLKDYGNQELIERNNEMSLIMLINKIQGADGFHDFRKTALDYFKSIYGRTTANIQDVILEVIWGLLMKIEVPKEEAADMLRNVREGKDMGVLFENFQKFDWKEAQKKLEEAEKRREEAETTLQEMKIDLQDTKDELLKAQALIAELQKNASGSSNN